MTEQQPAYVLHSRPWRESSVIAAASHTHLRAHETPEQLVCRLLLEKKKQKKQKTKQQQTQ